MILPQTYLSALLIALLSMVCLGTWANALKLAPKWRFELFYWDFSFGAVIAATLAAFTLGTLGFDGFLFMDDLMRASKHALFYAAVAGLIFNLGNILLVSSVGLIGLSLTFSVGMPVALAAGVIWALVLRPHTNPVLSFIGAALSLGAVAIACWVHYNHAMAKAKEVIKSGKAKSTIPRISWKGIILCAVGGLFLGSFSPLVDMAKEGDSGLGPYSILFIFSVCVLVSTFVYNLFFMNLPVDGPPVEVPDYFKKGKPKYHIYGLASGLIWAIGALAGVLAASANPEVHFSVALSGGLPQAGAVLTVLWGLLAWKEFAGSEGAVKVQFTLLLILYTGGVALVSIAPLFPK